MRVAVCQMNGGGGDVASNVATAEQLVRDGAARGARLAALPELFTCYGTSREMRAAAEPLDGPTLTRFAGLARELGIWLLAGSLPESGEDGRVRNTSVLIDPDGERAAVYRKIHLFDVDIDGQPPIRESATFVGGDQLVTHVVDGVRVGLSICYDVRFPELYRGLVALGAEVVFVPSAFTAVTGEAHWEVLLRARAIEDQCFVVAPAQWGTWGPPEDGRRCYGHSLVVDPWGRVVDEASPDGDAVLVVDLDLAQVRAVRQRLPALAHRRLGTVC